GWRPIIRFAENEHHRGLHILDVSERRSCLELLLAIKWRRLEPVRLEESQISRVPPIFPARDVALRNRCGKSVRLSHNPVREQTAAASTGLTKFFIFDIPALYLVIHPFHQIFIIYLCIL